MKKQSSKQMHEILMLAFWSIVILVLILISYLLDHFNLASIYITAGLALIAILLGGTWRFIDGIKSVCRGKITVNTFVTVSLTATMLIGEFLAAAIVIFIMTVAEAVEEYTLDKSRSGIQNLLDLAPKMANVIRGGSEVTIPVENVNIDDIVIVKPGEGIPVDGIVISGKASINQSAISLGRRFLF